MSRSGGAESRAAIAPSVVAAAARPGSYSDSSVKLRVLSGHLVVVVVVDRHTVKEHRQHDYQIWFAKAPPTALRGVIPPNRWVANSGGSTRGVSVAREIGVRRARE